MNLHNKNSRLNKTFGCVFNATDTFLLEPASVYPRDL